MIEILCSGVSLGHYVPGLLVRDRLLALGVAARVRVFEQLLEGARRDRIEETRRAYRASLRVATTAQRLAGALTPAAEPAAADALLEEWSAARPHLLVVSGYWLPLVRRWVAGAPAERRARVELFHVDTTESPGWRAQAIAGGELARSWWCDAAAAGDGDPAACLRFQIPAEPPAAAREPRVLVHGGGWGIGDYRDAVAALVDAGLGVDLVAYEEADLAALRPGVRGVLLDPAWRPWAGDHADYPPLAVVGAPAAEVPPGGHRLLSFVARALAVVSKPGGATLIDSLAAATPIAFVTAFGAHEAANAALWCRLGGGVAFAAWRAQGFDRAVVERGRQALAALRARTPSYPDALARRLGAA
jgi:hypothetical protein